jgi:hypothetical protein
MQSDPMGWARELWSSIPTVTATVGTFITWRQWIILMARFLAVPIA